TAAEHGARGAMVEGAAMAIGRQDFAILVNIAASVRQLDRDATGERHVALAVYQALAGIVDGNQRRGTRGLDVYAWAAQVEHVGGAGSQKILVIAGVAQQEHADLIDQLRVAADIE